VRRRTHRHRAARRKERFAGIGTILRESHWLALPDLRLISGTKERGRPFTVTVRIETGMPNQRPADVVRHSKHPLVQFASPGHLDQPQAAAVITTASIAVAPCAQTRLQFRRRRLHAADRMNLETRNRVDRSGLRVVGAPPAPFLPREALLVSTDSVSWRMNADY
jgi:hypothetical protein